jgi:hypothetical protein
MLRTSATLLLLALTLPVSRLEAQCAVSNEHFPSDPTASAGFGTTLDFDGAVAVVGAPSDGQLGAGAGAIYVFEFSGTDWVETAKLTATDGAAGDALGHSVSIDGDVIVAAAKGAQAVYVFSRFAPGSPWGQAEKLVSSVTSKDFGDAVAVSGTTLAIGDHEDAVGRDLGIVWIFDQVGGFWTESTKLAPSDNAAKDAFGLTLDLEGDTLVASSTGDDDQGADSGSVYVFERVAGVWGEVAKLTAPDGAAGDHFGASVAVSGTAVIVGAPDKSDLAAGAGAAYAARKTGGSWGAAVRFTGTPTSAGAAFGTSVAVEGVSAMVGAPGDVALGVAGGSAWLYGDAGASWVPADVFVAGDAAAGDALGTAVAMDSGNFHLGAPGDDAGAADAGSFYTFDPLLGSCTPLTAFPASISVSAGGVQTMTLDAGTANQGAFYWLVGSVTGTSPGLFLFGALLPLNPDPYFFSTVLSPNLGPFTNNFGNLDTQGRAVVPFTLGAGSDPALAGLTLDHAFVVVDFGAPAFTFVSNTTGLALAP